MSSLTEYIHWVAPVSLAVQENLNLIRRLDAVLNARAAMLDAEAQRIMEQPPIAPQIAAPIASTFTAAPAAPATAASLGSSSIAPLQPRGGVSVTSSSSSASATASTKRKRSLSQVNIFHYFSFR